MKSLALAFLIGALAPALRAAAQADAPSGTANDPAPPADSQKNGGPPPTTDLVNGSPTKMGYSPGQQLTSEQQKAVDERKGKAMDGGNQMVDFNQAAKNLSPGDRATAEAAMNHGLTPIIVGGKIMGYDDPIGQMDWLPDAVAKQFANEVKTPQDPTPGQTSADAADAAARAVADAAGRAGGDSRPPDQQSSQPHQPPANPTPEQRMQNDIAHNDVHALENDITDQRNQEQNDKANANEPGGGPALSGPGTSNPDTTPVASNQPGGGGPISMSASGHTFGANGQVAGDSGGPGAGSRQYAPVHDEAASLMAFNQGLQNGPLQGPSDPHARSVYETAMNFLGGHAILQALGLEQKGTEAVAAVGGQLSKDGSALNDQAPTAFSQVYDNSGPYRPQVDNPKLCTGKDYCWNGSASDPNRAPL